MCPHLCHQKREDLPQNPLQEQQGLHIELNSQVVKKCSSPFLWLAATDCSEGEDRQLLTVMRGSLDIDSSGGHSSCCIQSLENSRSTCLLCDVIECWDGLLWLIKAAILSLESSRSNLIHGVVQTFSDRILKNSFISSPHFSCCMHYCKINN